MQGQMVGGAAGASESLEWGSIPEEAKIPAPDCLGQLVVGLQGCAQAGLGEVLVLGDLPQQQAHQNEPLADHHSEAQSTVGSLKHAQKGKSLGGVVGELF